MYCYVQLGTVLAYRSVPLGIQCGMQRDTTVHAGTQALQNLLMSVGEVEAANLLRHIPSDVLHSSKGPYTCTSHQSAGGADTSGSRLRQPTSLTLIPISSSRARAVAGQHMTSRDDHSAAMHLIYRATSVSCPWCRPESLLVVAGKGL